MSLKIGVSGVRGIFGESLTEDVISDFAKAFGTFIIGGQRPYFWNNNKRKRCKKIRALSPYLLVGRDTRTSGNLARKAVVDGLLAIGCNVTDLGIAPTPTMLFAARHFKADGAIIITASHNSAQWNGLKFVRPDGTFLTKDEADKLIEIYKSKKFKLAGRGGPQRSSRNDNCRGTLQRAPARLHLDAVVKAVDAAAIKKAKFKVAVDCCNGTGAVTTPYLLKKLGCEIVAINFKPDGKFAHNPEPAPENLKQLAAFVKSQKADIGFAQDPDADRLSVVSEKGLPIGEENTLALAVKHVLSKVKGQRLKVKGKALAVVVNLSTSRMIDDIAREFGAKVYRSAVGETNVVDKMRKVKAIIGGEGNGGVIYPAVNFGRDSFVAMALILEYMAKSGRKNSELVNSIKQYYIEKTKIGCPQEKIASALKTIKDNVSRVIPSLCLGRCLSPAKGRAKNLFFPCHSESLKLRGRRISFLRKNRDSSVAINEAEGLPQNDTSSRPILTTIDGVKIDYPDGWVHVRGSNTEPVIRITAEAQIKESAKEYIDRIKNLINSPPFSS